MSSRRPSKIPARKSRPGPASSTAGSTVLAFVVGAAVAAGAGYLYLHSRPAVQPAPIATAVAPPPLTPMPKSAQPATPSPPRTPPFGTSEDVFEAGAHLYAARCASCHGTPSHDVAAKPPAPQLWRAARRQATSPVPGDLYKQIAVGNPAKGMPAYAGTFTTTQLWQLTLLLKNASQDLPDPVLAILNAPRRN